MPRPRSTEGTESDELIVLRTIRDSVRERGYPPSQRELAEACGWSSPSGANYILKLMEARGLLDVSRGIPRGLRITPAGEQMVAQIETV